MPKVECYTINDHKLSLDVSKNGERLKQKRAELPLDAHGERREEY